MVWMQSQKDEQTLQRRLLTIVKRHNCPAALKYLVASSSSAASALANTIEVPWLTWVSSAMPLHVLNLQRIESCFPLWAHVPSEHFEDSRGFIENMFRVLTLAVRGGMIGEHGVLFLHFVYDASNLFEPRRYRSGVHALWVE